MATGDDVSAALGAVWDVLFPTLSTGWIERGGGVVAGVSGLPIPTLNGLWPTADTMLDPGSMTVLLDRVAAAGVPHCIQARPSTTEPAGRMAAARGMLPEEEIPLMVLEDPAALGRVISDATASGLEIRKVGPDDAELHADVAARGFGVPTEIFRALVPPAVLRLPGVAAYVGVIGDALVTTALCVTIGDFVGVFNVGTPEEYRRRGFGGAVTAQAARDGLAAGASAAWLQSSAAGYGVYEGLGFRTIERWPCWISA